MPAAASLVLLLLAGPWASADEAARAALARLGAQAALEAPAPGTQAARPGREAPLPPRPVEALPPGPGARPPVELPDAGSRLWALALLAVLGGALLAFLLAALAGRLRNRARRAPPGAAPATPVPAPLPAAALGTADQLAAAGDWDGAVHRLLQDALALLAARSGEALPPHLTSRELLARLPLEAGAREVLAGLVEAVELSHFGGRRLDGAAWAAARARYARLAADGARA